MGNLQKVSPKQGFTIAEMLVVLAILGIFAVATASILSKRHTKLSSVSPHGQFECYVKDDGIVYQKTTIENNAGAEIVVGPVTSAATKCIFTPLSKRVAYYMVALVGGGGSGSNNNGVVSTLTDYGGKAGSMTTMFFPEFTTDTVTMKPGVGGVLPASGVAIGGSGGASTFNEGSIIAGGGLGGVAATATAEEGGGGGGGSGSFTPVTDTEDASNYVLSNVADYICSGASIPSATSSTGYLCVNTSDTTSTPIDTCSDSTYDTRGWSNTYCMANHWAGLKSSCAASGKRLPTYAEITGPFRTDYLGANTGGFDSSRATASSDEYDASKINVMNIGLNWGLNISKGSDPTYTRCVKETKNNGSSILCLNNTTTSDAGDYLCVSKANTPQKVSSQAKYQELYNFYRGSSSLNVSPYGGDFANYASDYWYGALERCYDMDAKHNWRLPTYAEFNMLINGGVATAGKWNFHKYSSDTTMAYIQTSSNTESLISRNSNAIQSSCVRVYTPPSADICVDNTLTTTVGDQICMDSIDYPVSMGISSQTKYAEMKTHYGSNFNNYYSGNVALYYSDAWGKALERCYDKDSTGHSWRLPTTAELGLFQTAASLSATKTYWAGPDTDTASSPSYLNGAIGSSTRGTKSNYSRCVTSGGGTAPESTGCDGTVIQHAASSTGYLCVDSTDMTISPIGIGSIAYNQMKAKGLIKFDSGYTADYWAGAVYQCDQKGMHLPTYTETEQGNGMSECNTGYGDNLSEACSVYNNLTLLNLTSGKNYWSGTELTGGYTTYSWLIALSGVKYRITKDTTTNYTARCVKEYTPSAGGGEEEEVSTTGEISKFDGYWQAGGYTFSVLKSGDGGDAKAAGHPGAILIIW